MSIAPTRGEQRAPCRGEGGGVPDKIEPYPRFLSQLAEKHDCRPTRFARCFAFREDENDTPTDRRVSPLFRPRAQGEKRSFGEWLLNAACRDSGAIGAGYEGELKDGRFKGKKK